MPDSLITSPQITPNSANTPTTSGTNTAPSKRRSLGVNLVPPAPTSTAQLAITPRSRRTVTGPASSTAAQLATNPRSRRTVAGPRWVLSSVGNQVQ